MFGFPDFLFCGLCTNLSLIYLKKRSFRFWSFLLGLVVCLSLLTSFAIPWHHTIMPVAGM
jgi:hypothetical protein